MKIVSINFMSLTYCLRFSLQTDFHDLERSLNVVLQAMSRHLLDKQIQIAATASLFFIVKSDEAKNKFSIEVKRYHVISILCFVFFEY